MSQPKFDKQTLRRDAKALRDNLDSVHRRECSEIILKKIIDLEVMESFMHISLFAGSGSEVDTEALILNLIEKDKPVYLPRVIKTPDGRPDLELYRVKIYPDDCRPGPFGIQEPDPEKTARLQDPSRLDIILVPGLLFDESGHRLGYGGGYYDRLLSCLDRTFKIGIAFQSQMVTRLPADPWDVPIDAVMTETDYYRFSRGRAG
jgi:5-formyltetrahydrofolate cyclo-ligase